MSLQSYTFLALQTAAQHATGIATPDTGSTWANVVNDVLSDLAMAHPWSWRQSALALSTVISQTYIALPADFASIKTIRGNSTVQRAVIPTTLDHIALMRTQSTTGGLVLYYALSWTTQASVTASPIARLEIYPTPSASEPVLQGTYLRQIANLSANTDLPDIDPSLFSLLKMMVRARAILTEKGTEGPEAARAAVMLEEAKARDGKAQPRRGEIRGILTPGAADVASADYGRFFPYSGITA